MTSKDLPNDSLLKHWTKYLNSTEIPFSYQVAVGLSCLGSLLRRQRYIDQLDWRVYPNQSVLLIGPSGIGKDTVINRGQRMMEDLEPLSRVPVLGGMTFENVQKRLSLLGDPACAYLPAAELTKFFGKADYQSNMLTGMTDILSTGEKIDITIKGDLANGGSPQYIHKPTVTMQGGSTVEWLHKHMPSGTLEGGFLGRFLIVVEELGRKQVPLVKGDKTVQEIQSLQRELESWLAGVREIVTQCAVRQREVILDEEAEALYGNWYHNRHRLFSRAVGPYANRSRDTVLRIAMLMAFTRGHLRLIEGEDISFAIKIMDEIAKKIDRVVLPPTDEAKAAQQILELLPCPPSQIYGALGVKFPTKVIEGAINLLRCTRQLHADRARGLFVRETQ